MKNVNLVQLSKEPHNKIFCNNATFKKIENQDIVLKTEPDCALEPDPTSPNYYVL